MSPKLPQSVVFDEPLARAFLTLARQEKLIEDQPHLTDFWLESFTRDEPSAASKRVVLEQITMTPTVIWPYWIPKTGIHGQLVEEQILVAPAAARSVPPVTQRMSVEWVVEMLSARGMNMTVEEVMRLSDLVMTASRACQRIEDARGQTFPTKMDRVLREVFARHQKVNWQPFSDEDMKAQFNLETALDAWGPVRRCIETFALTVATADDSDALVRVPFSLAAGAEGGRFAEADAYERGNHALLAVVSDELGRIPFRPTLRDTLKLAKDPATAALREQLAVWKATLEATDDRGLPSIRSEVAAALRSLQRATMFSKVGRWMTLLSVPVGSLGFFLSGVPGTLPGFAVSVAGALAQESAQGLQRAYRWAMFGNH